MRAKRFRSAVNEALYERLHTGECDNENTEVVAISEDCNTAFEVVGVYFDQKHNFIGVNLGKKVKHES